MLNPQGEKTTIIKSKIYKAPVLWTAYVYILIILKDNLIGKIIFYRVRNHSKYCDFRWARL